MITDELFEKAFNENKQTLDILASRFFIPGGSKDDLFQEATIGLIKALRTYREEIGVPFSAYVYLCAKSQIITAIKSATRHKNCFFNGAVGRYEMADLENMAIDCRMDYNLIEKETTEEIIVELAKLLSPQEKEAFKYLVNGYGYQEISKLLSITPKQVDNTIQRIRRKTRRVI